MLLHEDGTQLFPVHFGCSAHLLNLAFQDAVESDEDVEACLKKSKRLIAKLSNVTELVRCTFGGQF